MCGMGQNQNSIIVLQIWPKFWWMIAMGVKYNHTKLAAGNGCCKWHK